MLNGLACGTGYGGMTGSMTVALSCHGQADTLLDRQSHLFIMGAMPPPIMKKMTLPVKLSVSLTVA